MSLHEGRRWEVAYGLCKNISDSVTQVNIFSLIELLPVPSILDQVAVFIDRTSVIEVGESSIGKVSESDFGTILQ